jgi:exonuclease-1
MNRVRMLVHFGITPYIVFDGDYLPSKSGTEKERAAKRKESKRVGLELMKVGKASQAQLELQKAVDVTPEMARLLIEELKHHNIQYIVAPYEADSQLAYLERIGVINGIMSEDSDLLVFGAKCLITKLDKYGECIEINRNHFTACREVSLVGWSDADFRRMAILSGCDYLPSIGKMGLKTAHRMLRKHKTVERLVKAAQFDGQFKVPAGYLEAFIQAENTFLYPWVFCPNANQLVNLTAPEIGVDITAMPYIGAQVPADLAIGVANGNLHPHTKQPIIVPVKDQSRSKPLRPARTAAPAQTPDLKHSKPIDSFFKSKRTPLAELDPNIFTPSPSQQVLLQQQQENTGWAAVAAPLSQPQRHSAPQPPRRTISDSMVGRRSVPHPPKRQRLCSDAPFGTPAPQDVKDERSKFFASSILDPSPSLRTGRRRKTAHDFDMYSDDSIGQAMSDLVDLEEATSQPKKKIAIFKDDSKYTTTGDSQSTTISRSITDQSQDTAGTLTPATSCGSSPPDEDEETVFSAVLSSQVKALRSKFSFQAATTTEEHFTGSNVLNKSRKDISTQKKLRRALTGTFRAGTALQEDLTREFSPKRARPEDEQNELEDSAWAALEAEVVVAASDTEEAVDTLIVPETPKRVKVRGSEDLIVPDSEAESDCSPRKPMLDLGRFAFAGI